uniref:Uncharacterized protein n=1 Tax=Pithovirus LCDPAC02 TaxID=2506601 RepID=A0A481YPP7_9VIRU|nr:MAG: hypothetical protein LCDPAC02_01890 [Pithovirus LCDPAC02]
MSLQDLLVLVEEIRNNYNVEYSINDSKIVLEIDTTEFNPKNKNVELYILEKRSPNVLRFQN